MCGIWAVLSKNKMGFFKKDSLEKLIAGLATASQIRGVDSSGIFWLNRNQEGTLPAYCKNTTTGSLFLLEKPVKAAIDELFSKGMVMVGHHRAATVGDVTVDNAHPFREGTVTLVHNGTLRSGYGKFQKEGGSDSHALAVALNEHKKDALKDITGAYAMIWHDTDDNCVHIARNMERPLCYFEDEDRVVVASTPHILFFALYLAEIDTKKGAFKEFKEKVHYRWDFNNCKWLEEGEMPTPTYTTTYQSPTTWVSGGNATKVLHFVEAEVVVIDPQTSKGNFNRYLCTSSDGVQDFHFFAEKADNRFEVGDIIRGQCDQYDISLRSTKLKSSSVTLVRTGKPAPTVAPTVVLANAVVVPYSDFISEGDGRCVCCNTKFTERDAHGSLHTNMLPKFGSDMKGYVCADCLDFFQIDENLPI